MNLSHERFVRVLSSLKTDDGVGFEQRATPRVAVRSTVLMAPLTNGQVGAAFTARLSEVSCGGASLSAFQPIPPGTQLVVEFPERQGEQDEPDHLRILARVVHCRPTNEHQFVVGLQFVRVYTADAPSLDAAAVEHAEH